MIGTGLGFEEVKDLGRYLGVPLLHSKVTKSTYTYLLEKVRSHLTGWAARSLSLAGRITLAKSVLQAIPTYAMQSTWLPKGFCTELEKLVRGFVWGNGASNRGLSLINWNDLKQPIEGGGLGFRDMHKQNKALIMKIGFQLVSNADKLWVKAIKSKYGWGAVIPHSLRRRNCSRLWLGLSHVWGAICDNLCWNINNGATTNFWYDNWLNLSMPLASLSMSLTPPAPMKVCDVVDHNGQWNWEFLSQALPDSILPHIAAVCPPSANAGADTAGWRGEETRCFSTKSAYKALNVSSQVVSVSDWRLVWKLPVPQRIRVFIWLALRGRLLTNVERTRRHLAISSSCSICGRAEESIVHVLRDCPKARAIWSRVVPASRYQQFMLKEEHAWLLENVASAGSGLIRPDWQVWFVVICWTLWKRRCSIIMNPSFVERGDLFGHCHLLVEEILHANAIRMAPPSNHGLVVESWKLPAAGYVKVNVDAAVNVANGSAATGVVIRDSDGSWIVGGARSIGVCSVLSAELWAVHDGLQLAWSRGCRRIELETDNMEVAHIFQGKSSGFQGSALTKLIHKLLAYQWEVKVRHVRRSANKVADALARMVRGGQIGACLFEVPPWEVATLLTLDVQEGMSQL